MSAAGAIEMPVASPDAGRPARADVSSRKRPLRVVRESTPADAISAVGISVADVQPRSSSIPILTGTVVAGTVVTGPVVTDTALTGAGVPGRAHRSRSSADGRVSPAPLRLTRRGRFVVGAFFVTVFSVAVLLVTMLVSGHAQATNHGEPGAGYQGMHQVVVQPGQTLWSIGAKADPSADPRDVVQEIMSANALSSPSITAGQLLWVP